MTMRHKEFGYLRTLLALFLVLHYCAGAYAVSRAWRNDTQGSWHVAGNWVPDDDYPKENDTAVIDQGEVRFGSTVQAMCKDLVLGGSVGCTGRMLMDLNGGSLNVGTNMVVGSAGSEVGRVACYPRNLR